MKRLVYFCLCVVLLSGTGSVCRASHIYGADLLYTHLAGNLYKVTLTLYGDCGADATLFNQLYSALPRIAVYNGSTFYDTVFLKLFPGSGIEVSPVCPSQIGNTKCNGGTLPGIKQFIYSDTITLSGPSTVWTFRFSGFLGSGTSPTGTVTGYSAGRSVSITNAQPGTVMQIEATLNTLNGPNSSPQYSTIPTPFYCINILQQYNHGAADPDADSLAFTMVPAIDAQTSSPVSYIYPFSANAPLAVTGGAFSFSSLNGQMTFNPNAIQDALVVIKVSEYKNGLLVGTSERELTFIVHDNCDGTPPVANITSLAGATLSGTNVLNICKGESQVSFTIGLNNPGGDSTLLTANNVPASASLTISNNNTPNPIVHFSWGTGSLQPGHYTFYLTIKSNHCPLFNIQTIAYTINVANHPTISVTELAPTHCVDNAAVAYTLAYGFIPRTVTIMNGGAVVKTITDNSTTDAGVVVDSLPAGTYTAIVSSDALCVDSVNFTIVDSGFLPVSDIDESLCKGDPILPIYVKPAGPGAAVNWFQLDNTPFSGPPVGNTESVANFAWYFIETYKVCTSRPVSVTAEVHALPQAEILNIPQTVCYGDDIYLKAAGGTDYTWQPENVIKKDTNGLYVEVITPITVVVFVKDQYGCSDTASVAYTDIQQCCLLTYPNAFTPNNDGHNDGFRIVTYGNMRYYELTIFNRWGQRVFSTTDPHRAWDGTFGGVPCEIGTYYYYLKAECLTGPKTTYKGDLVLIR